MKKIYISLISLLFLSIAGKTQINTHQNYNQAFKALNLMFEDETQMNFKEAVFIVENAYLDRKIDKQKFNKQIIALISLIVAVKEQSELRYTGSDKIVIEKNAALFRLMKDTVPIYLDSTTLLQHLPFIYDFEDMWGEKEWSNMFVTKLLATHKGNCHSLPFLYKILADELGVEAHLALAPNHIYIKTKSEKYGWYNTELTSGMFPIDAWIMASGYIHLNAIQNRLYMSALDDKQSIVICMTDLAEGYARKTDFTDPDFVIMCCDTALKHFPNYVNATLLKIKTLKHQFETELAKPEPDKEVSDKLFAEIERLSVELYKLGYRQMPKEMYLDWLVSLKTEKEKYTNKQIMNEEKK